MRRRPNGLVVGAVAAVLVALVGVCQCSRPPEELDVAMRARLFTPADAPAHEVAIVLGCAGELLQKRMRAACQLVQGGRAQRLVITGMPDEIAVMRPLALQCVPADALLVDDDARRTLDNLRHARDRFGVRDALVVTQRFHLGRALYLADALDMRAVGVVAEGVPQSAYTGARERVARLRARLDVLLLR